MKKMWIELLTQIMRSPEFKAEVSSERLEEAQALLGIRFPDELISFLLETNGVEEKDDMALIWEIDQIVFANLRNRNNPVFSATQNPFDSFLCIADTGIGGMFAYSISPTRQREGEGIFVWNPIDEEWERVASTLSDFLKGWCCGEIKI